MVKKSACNAEDPGSVPGLGRSPVEGNGNPLQYSCLENPMGRGAWWGTIHSITEIQIQLKWLSRCVCVCVCVCVYNMSILYQFSSVTQLYPTLCDPMDCSLPGFSCLGILQARILEWVAMPSCRGSSQPRDGTQVSRIAGRFLYHLSHQGSLINTTL